MPVVGPFLQQNPRHPQSRNIFVSLHELGGISKDVFIRRNQIVVQNGNERCFSELGQMPARPANPVFFASCIDFPAERCNACIGCIIPQEKFWDRFLLPELGVNSFELIWAFEIC